MEQFTTLRRDHIYLYDRDANESGVFDEVHAEGGVSVILVSTDPEGLQGDSGSWRPVISADGRFVAFESYASNLTAEATGGVKQLFVRDLQEGETQMVSVSSAGVPGDGCGNRASMSSDGRYVAFRSWANNLTEKDTNWYNSIYVRDLVEGKTTLVSINDEGEVGNGNSDYPSISADGRYVAFHSRAENLVEQELERWTDYVYIHDRHTEKTTIIAPTDITGEVSSYSRYLPTISQDGRYVAFLSYDPLLAPGKSGDNLDLFLYDRDVNETGSFDQPGGTSITLEGVSSTGQAGDGSVTDWECWYRSTPAFNEDARFIAFSSNATNLAPGINNNTRNVFVRDRAPEADVVTMLTYTGPTAWVEESKVILEGRLTDVGTGQGLENLKVSFTLGGLSGEAYTDQDGIAELNVDLTPLSPGTYTLVAAFPGDANHAPSSETLEFVVAENNPPVAETGGPYRVFKGEDLLLDGSASLDHDPGDQIVSWEWDLKGNGTFDDAAGETVQLTWEEIVAILCGGSCEETRECTIGLRVTDTLGISSEVSTTVQVIVDYSLEVAPDIQAVAPGGSNAFAVSLLSVEEFAGPVTLDIQELPYGLSAKFSPHTIVPGEVAVLTISAEPDAPSAIFDLVVEGSSGEMVRTGIASVRVAFGLIPVSYGAIAGRVTDQETGQPLPGVRVDIGQERFTTDDDGRFHWDEVPLGTDNAPRNYTVSTEPGGYWRAQESVTAINGVVRQVDLELVLKRTGAVEGRVMVGVMEEDAPVPTGEPLPEATVQIISPYLGSYIDVDSEGEYQLENLNLNHNNAPRNYRIRAAAAGYWPQEKVVSVEGDLTKHLDFELVEICYSSLVGGQVLVRMKDGLIAPEGEGGVVPFEGVAVSVITDSNRGERIIPQDHHAITGTDGEFLMDPPIALTLGHNNIPPGEYFIKMNYLHDCEHQTGPEVSYYPIDIIQCDGALDVGPIIIACDCEALITTSGELEGFVFDEESGEPVQNALVQVQNRSVRTDEDGYYSISQISLEGELSRTFTVTASANGYWEERTQVTLFQEQTVQQDFNILQERFAEVEGTVTDAVTGLPLEGVSIWEGQRIRATTDANGFYSITGLSLRTGNQPRSISLRATKEGYWQQSQGTTLYADETSVVNFQMLEICEAATISGLVVNALTLEPIEGATITAAGKTANTNEQGWFQLLNIEAGYNNSPRDVSVRAEAPGFHPQTKVVTVFCGAHIIVDFGRVDTEVGTIIGTVTSSSTGHPLPDVFIGSEFGGSSATDAEGNYRLSNVPLGEGGAERTWELTASPPLLGVEPQSANVTARAGEEVRLDFQFAIDIWELILGVNGEGTITPEPGRYLYYDDSTSVFLEAFPAEGWVFSHWEGDIGGQPADQDTVILTMDRARAVTAVFEPEALLYTLTVTSTAGGSVTEPGEGTFTYVEDEVVNLVAAVEEGYSFVHWSGDVDTVMDVNAASSAVTMEGDYTISAEFEEIPVTEYDLNISSSDGGSVTEPGEGTFTYVEDEVVNLVAAAEEGYSFVHWSGNVDTVTDVNAASSAVTMEGDKSLTAVFAEHTHTITATAGTGGNIDPSGEVEITHGADQTFTITADEDYVIADVLVDGDSIGAVTSYTFQDVTSDHTIAAVFAAVVTTYDLTVTSTAGGSVIEPGEGTFTYVEDEVVNLVAAAAEGYRFVHWSGDVDTVTDVNAASSAVTMEGDYTISAKFEEIPVTVYELNISSSGGGSVTAPGEGTFIYTEDEVVTITAVAEDGYVFTHWSDDVGTVDDVNAASTTIAMEGSYEISANFTQIIFTITATAGTGGSIDPSGAVEIIHGTDQTFTITADEGYEIADVLVDGDSIGAVTSHTFQNVTSDHAIAAVFAAAVITPALSIGYWRNHEAHLQELLNLGSFELGDTTVETMEEALDVLTNTSARDARDALRNQLLATVLNLRHGSDPLATGIDIRLVVGQSTALLNDCQDEELRARHPRRKEALDLKDALDVYNNSGSN